jgi:ATP-dependent DNA helicase RecG
VFSIHQAIETLYLKTLKLMTLRQGRLVPTTGGILLFGFEREKYFPDAWIQAEQFAGTDRSELIATSEIHECPIQAIEQAFLFIKRKTSRHTQTWTYPLVALREALVNAVLHADYAQQGTPIRIAIYSDRLEIENPGLLLKVTIDEIQQGLSKLRNRVISRVFHALGMVEQWGGGIQRMITACEEAGLDLPRFQEIGTGFRVTFFRAQKPSPPVDPFDQKIPDKALRSRRRISKR